MKRYYNKEENLWYTEGTGFTKRTDEGLFSGVPTEEQLKEWGFEECVAPSPEPLTEEESAVAERRQRMNEIVSELKAMDYLTSKFIDGEDMSAYGDWREKRRLLRAEYRELRENVMIVGAG